MVDGGIDEVLVVAEVNDGVTVGLTDLLAGEVACGVVDDNACGAVDDNACGAVDGANDAA